MSLVIKGTVKPFQVSPAKAGGLHDDII